MKFYSMNKEQYNKTKKVRFKNVARDFYKEVIVLGKTKSGNLKMGDIFAEGPSGIKYQIRLVKYDPKKKKYMFNTGGSAFNTYYYRP